MRFGKRIIHHQIYETGRYIPFGHTCNSIRIGIRLASLARKDQVCGQLVSSYLGFGFVTGNDVNLLSRKVKTTKTKQNKMKVQGQDEHPHWVCFSKL